MNISHSLRTCLIALIALSETAFAGVPSPPSLVTAVAGNGRAKVSWNAPTDSGGSPITGYVVTSTVGKGCRAKGTSSSCTVTGLANAVSVTFNVIASNASGQSAPSDSTAPVIPFKKKVPALCGTASGAYAASSPNQNDLCLNGQATGLQQGSDSLYHWSCLGYGGGANASCASGPWTPPTYKVGDTGPGGGFVFYVGADPHHGMEVRGPLIKQSWGCYGVNAGAYGTGIGSGATNTALIKSKCSDPNAPAIYAARYAVNGYSDWYLPSRDEMLLIAPYADYSSGGFIFYWTSTEAGDGYVDVVYYDPVLGSPGKFAGPYYTVDTETQSSYKPFTYYKFYVVRSF